MGLIKSLFSGAKKLRGPEETPAEKATKLKRKQELYEVEDKARFTEQKRLAAERGKKSARGGSGFGSGAMQFGKSLNQSIGNVERNLGFDKVGASGLDFGLGFGGAPAKAKKPMGKVTKIQTNGKTITIRDTAPEGQAPAQKKQVSPYRWMDDIPNFLEE